MSRHYILDGYNVLHSTHRWDALPRAAKRLAFLKFLDETRPTGSEKNSVTVVLDGYAAELSRVKMSLVRLVFSGDKDADTVIKERVTDLANPRDAVIVTNDRGIQSAVRGMGAAVMSCEDFFKLRHARPPRGQRQKVDSAKADSINAELKRLWKLD